MYSIIPAANGPIKYHYNSDRYLELAMKNLSLTESVCDRTIALALGAPEAGRRDNPRVKFRSAAG